MNEKQTTAAGIGLCDLLFIAFVVLKLTNVIAWSWWWVTAPLWIPFATVVLLFGIVVGIATFSDNTYTRNKGARR